MGSEELNYEQMLRYSRHIMLPAIDLDGQTKILNAHVLIIGLGGLGCSTAQFLAASGIGKLTLVDDDIVEKTNLQRQVLHMEAALGMAKVDSAKQTLSQINSSVKIDTLDRRLTELELVELVKQVDVVADCTDTLSSRQLINQVCFDYKTPLVSGAAIRFEGQIATFSMQPETPCYECYSGFFTETLQSCSESGVFSPIVGVVGTLQAAEMLKLITGVGKILTGQLLCIDVQSMTFNSFGIPKASACPVCNEQRQL